MRIFMKLIVALMLTLVFAAPVLSSPEVCNSFPDNDLYISHLDKSVKGIKEKQFNDSIDLAEKIYKPIFKEKYKADLVVIRKWEDGTVNAYAQQTGKTWKVSMFGGLARHDEATQDGFTAVLCHEIGHHIGGAPKKKTWMSTSWASNEGQADYFSTAKCLKRLFQDKIRVNLREYRKAKTKEQLFAKAACDKTYASTNEAALCYRSAEAGKSLARLLGSLRGNAEVKYITPDPKVAPKTVHSHPPAQCRLDTYFQGSLCDKDFEVYPSSTDAAAGYCVRSESYDSGIRPLCWYKPEAS